MTMPNLPVAELENGYHWWHRFNPRNWRGETWRAEFERRVKATEASVRSAHDRINDFNERMAQHNGSCNCSGSK